MIAGVVCDIVKDTEVDGGRREEAEGLANLEQVDGVDVEDGLQLVRVVRPHVALVRLLGRHVQEVVLRHQLLQLIKNNTNKCLLDRLIMIVTSEQRLFGCDVWH